MNQAFAALIKKDRATTTSSFSSCVCTRASTSLYKIGAVSFKKEQNKTLCPEQQQRPLSGHILSGRCHSESKGQLRLDCDLRYIKFAVD